MTSREQLINSFSQSLETALASKDFKAIRVAVRNLGYQVAEDESEPDLSKALPLVIDKNLTENDDEYWQTREDHLYLLTLEKEIRGRQVETLRLLFHNSGCKIQAPDFDRLTAEETERRRTNRPTYLPYRCTLDC